MAAQRFCDIPFRQKHIHVPRVDGPTGSKLVCEVGEHRLRYRRDARQDKNVFYLESGRIADRVIDKHGAPWARAPSSAGLGLTHAHYAAKVRPHRRAGSGRD